jgi:uncharacterized RDD family membrane protein YckC
MPDPAYSSSVADRKLGAVYALSDHAGFLERLLIELLDVSLVGVVWLALTWVGLQLGLPDWVSRLASLLLAWGYLAALKVTPHGTLGYRVLHVKLVDLQGNPVKLWKSSLRFLLIFLGPVNVLFDIFWLTNDPNRQTLRDKIAGTYVIREHAAPVDRRPITYPMYFVGGLSFVIPEVLRRDENAAAATGKPPRG